MNKLTCRLLWVAYNSSFKITDTSGKGEIAFVLSKGE